MTFSSVKAQVVVDSLSMPVPGDMLSMRTSTSVNGINYMQTGSNFIWNFTSLTSTTQAIDTFVNVLSTPLAYNVAFSNPFDEAHRATVAYKQSLMAMPMVQISDSYFFMKNSYQRFSQVGMGAKINGIAVPMKFDLADVLYHFPVTYATTDSSKSEFNVNIPSLGYYGQSRKRVNSVDGWGTLYLPADTFNVIRVKSLVNYSDTIYIDSLGFGFRNNRTETEYKWLSDQYHQPVLQIIKRNQGVSVKYYSSVPIDLGNEIIAYEDLFYFVNPVQEQLQIFLNEDMSEIYLNIFDVTGKLFYHSVFKDQSHIVIPTEKLISGIYFISIGNNEKVSVKKFVKN